MPRDYKHRVVHQRKRRRVSPWLGMIAGLLVGALVAAVVYLKLLAPHTPQQQTPAPAFMPETPAPPAKAAAPKVSPSREEKQEEKSAAPTPPKPRFDFYTILPEMEVVIPEEETGAKNAPIAVRPEEKTQEKPLQKPVGKPAEKPATATLPSEPRVKPLPAARGNYFLQTDSFHSAEQADRLKAQSAMLGLEASVHKVTINNKNTYYRVRVGPFRDFNTLDQARAQLRQHGIQSTPMMIGR
jgi:hypothetical protein